MNGWPATAARTLRSFRTCSTCFRRMTARIDQKFVSPGHIDTCGAPSVLRRILRAKTLSESSSFPVTRFASHTRANVPSLGQQSQFFWHFPYADCGRIPVPSVLTRSKSSRRKTFELWPTGFELGSTKIWSYSKGCLCASHATSLLFSSSRARVLAEELSWRSSLRLSLSLLPMCSLGMMWCIAAVAMICRSGGWKTSG